MNRKLTAEFIGTFFMTAVSVLAIKNANIGAYTPLAVGSLYIALIYAAHRLSGAHYNPAITLGIFMRGYMTVNQAVAYIATQIVAAIFAVFAAEAMLHDIIPAANLPFQPEIVPGLLSEFFGSFILIYVALSVTQQNVNNTNGYFGAAIGLTLMACLYTFGSVSGGAFNPALSIANCIGEVFTWEKLWIYLLGQLLGAAVAAIIYRFLQQKGEEESV